MRKRVVHSLIAVALSGVALIACGVQKEPTAPAGSSPTLTEAYRLMDKGQNAKAILLLEREVEKSPSSDEARTLLASAYMGEAGVTVYSIHDSFHDVLFAQPLGDSLWSGGGKKPKSTSPGALEAQLTEVNLDELKPDKTSLELFIARLDNFLTRFRKVVAFIDRFPDIEEEKWPLLESALGHLDQVKLSKDVRLYRVFIRIVYLKAFITRRVLKDPDFGTRSWACRVDLDMFRADLMWMGSHLETALEDFRVVFPDRARALVSLHAAISGMDQAFNESDVSGPPGSHTGMAALKKQISEGFKCETQ